VLGKERLALSHIARQRQSGSELLDDFLPIGVDKTSENSFGRFRFEGSPLCKISLCTANGSSLGKGLCLFLRLRSITKRHRSGDFN
jgi:hypothetical protein